jgi:excisionase family DNA binding protein
MSANETQHDDWLSLHEASALLGVATSTLRRWGDDGRVPMRRTLGGHRRFARQAIEQLAAAHVHVESMTVAHSQHAPESYGWGVDERELARQEWHARLVAQPGAARMRGLGQRLLGLLIQYINRREDDGRFLAEARAIGVTYGREAYEAQVSMHDTVKAFLFFRGAFSELTMPLPGIAHPTDLAATAALHARVNRFMDAILLGVIAGYESDEHRPAAP